MIRFTSKIKASISKSDDATVDILLDGSNQVFKCKFEYKEDAEVWLSGMSDKSLDSIFIEWTSSDVETANSQLRDPYTLRKAHIRAILRRLHHNHDASRGISWEDLEREIEDFYSPA